ncbi:MAG: CPBP family intramembrane metalloprotease [Chloroflexaceae bacterium]|jgi:hypothetical protein|nr:CPBP family intramembrane metalloprotease [Chloroflexaceae bacterium]
MHWLGMIFWNRAERRLRAGWRLVVFGLGVFLLLLALSIGSVFVGLPLLVTPAEVLIAYLSLPASLLSLWLAARLLDRRPLAAFGLQLDSAWWRDLAFGLALGALLMAAVFGLQWAAGWLSISGMWQTAQPNQPFALALLPPLVLFLCVGIYEELLFRGYLLFTLAQGLNWPRLGGARGGLLLALAISAALFGLAHASNPNATLVSSLNIGLAGLMLGLGYVLTGRLALPIGLHITWNFFQGPVFGFPVSGLAEAAQTRVFAIEQGGPELWTGGAFGPEAGLLGLLAMLLGSAAIAGWARWQRGRLVLVEELARAPAPKRRDAETERRRDTIL